MVIRRESTDSFRFVQDSNIIQYSSYEESSKDYYFNRVSNNRIEYLDNYSRHHQTVASL